ncbi:hypothetical protein BJ166DRAFT_512100 [Pestalotiopsis sp. NC0098]|nr:hypothetical protein BJ166DRAFT_512100 [Pestalotiopsis sp. NC0098]
MTRDGLSVPLTMLRFRVLFVLLLFLSLTRGSEDDYACGTAPGQPAVTHADGNFTFPNATSPIFQAGTSMNISWTTNFALSTLWLISGCNFAVPTKNLATGLADSYFVWDVETNSTNSSQVYSFRVVNSDGSDAAQRGGGFWSVVFYIYNETVAPSSSVTADPTATLSVFTGIQTGQTTSTANAVSQPSSTSVATTSDLSTGAKAGIGVGVSLGVVGLLGVAAGFYISRRRQNKNNDSQTPHIPTNEYDNTPKVPPYSEYQAHEMAVATPVAELHDRTSLDPRPVYEIG